jgi:ParB family chromosome partitioning protein
MSFSNVGGGYARNWPPIRIPKSELGSRKSTGSFGRPNPQPDPSKAANQPVQRPAPRIRKTKLLIPKQAPAQAERHATFPLARIRVGERFRRDMGDVASLAASMGSELGLLHPVVIRPDGTLIAGQRRLNAAKLLGWSEIPVNVIDLDAVVRGEYAENVNRKDFTLSEAVAIKRALEPVERAAAKDRQREGGRRGGEGSGKLPEASTGNAADKAAKATGMARRTLEKAEAIVDAAESEPERFGKLLADMDRTGRVNGVFKQLRIAKQAE